MAGEFRAPGWRRALAASLIAPVVAGMAFMPMLLIVPPFAVMATALGYAVALVPTLIGGMVQDLLMRTQPGWRSAARSYLTGAAVGVALFLAYLLTPIADVRQEDFGSDWWRIALLGLGCGSAGGAVAAFRRWLAHGAGLGRRRDRR